MITSNTQTKWLQVKLERVTCQQRMQFSLLSVLAFAVSADSLSYRQWALGSSGFPFRQHQCTYSFHSLSTQCSREGKPLPRSFCTLICLNLNRFSLQKLLYKDQEISWWTTLPLGAVLEVDPFRNWGHTPKKTEVFGLEKEAGDIRDDYFWGFGILKFETWMCFINL